MMVHTACASCGNELELPYDAVGADARYATHDGCPAAQRHGADMWLERFAGIVDKMMRPDYRFNEHDDLNLVALQSKIDELDKAPPRLGYAAVVYAGWGWQVFPLKPCQKVPATAHGFKDATTDVARIRRYWDANPTANIGIATGHAFDVIDVDLPDGPASWREMAAQPGAPDVHGIASTSSGGRHFLVAPTGIGNKARIRPGIDVRGIGGYIVAAPSWLGEHHRRWSWITKPSPTITRKATT